MTEESAKKSKLSWSKSLVRKWFNIRPKAQDFHADSDAGQGRDGGSGSWRPSCSAGEASASMAKKSRTGMLCNEPSGPYVHTPLSVPAAPPQLLAALQFHFVKLLSIFVLHQLLCSAMLNDCARMLFLVGL